jgi:hypothetical protein
MQQTIEEKLAAIKAINEKKDIVDADISAAIRIAEVQNSVLRLAFFTPGNCYDFHSLPGEVIATISYIIEAHLLATNTDLIYQAEAIMKS